MSFSVEPHQQLFNYGGAHYQLPCKPVFFAHRGACRVMRTEETAYQEDLPAIKANRIIVASLLSQNCPVTGICQVIRVQRGSLERWIDQTF